jgi:hypothetical protein
VEPRIMKYISNLKHKLQQSGFRGVISSALHQKANSVNRYEPKQQPNEFLAWIRYAVPGWLAQGNVEAMEYAVTNMPPGKPILEIGSFCGLSTVVMCYLLDKRSNTAPIYTCDKWEFEGQKLGTPLGDSPSVTHDIYQAYVRSTFLRTMHSFAANRLPYTMAYFSDEFFRHWFERETAIDVFGRQVTLGGEISFCYIDGNHAYEFAKRDFENTNRILVSGGFILFDDSADGSQWGVNRLTREVALGNEYELILKNPNYFFRKKCLRNRQHITS